MMIELPFQDLSIGYDDPDDDNWRSIDVTTSIGGRACFEMYCPPGTFSCTGGFERLAAGGSYDLGWDGKWTGMK